jgi:hypothetical protein
MKKLIVNTLLVLLAPLALLAQEEQEEPKEGFQKEKMFVGGYFGLTFGDYTLINISPQVGYRFNKVLAAGLGINGQYVSFKDWDSNGDPYKTNEGIIGLNVFGRVYPIPQLMLQVQPEVNYRFGKYTYYEESPAQEYKMDAVIVPSLLMGGGVIVPAGGKGALVVSIMYDVLQHDNSPYGNQPVYSFGVNIGL